MCSCICSVILSQGPVVCLQLCPLRLDPFLAVCLRLSLLIVSVVRRRLVFSLFLLSGAGEMQTSPVCISPSDSSSWPRTTSSTRTSSTSFSPRFPPRVCVNGLSGCLVCVFPPCFLPLGLGSEERKIRLTGAHGTIFREPIFSLSFRLADAAFLVCCFTLL